MSENTGCGKTRLFLAKYVRQTKFQKQPSRGVFRRSCFENMPKCEIALRHGCCHVNLLDIFRTPFLKNVSGRLLSKLTHTIFLQSRNIHLIVFYRVLSKFYMILVYFMGQWRHKNTLPVVSTSLKPNSHQIWGRNSYRMVLYEVIEWCFMKLQANFESIWVILKVVDVIKRSKFRKLSVIYITSGFIVSTAMPVWMKLEVEEII